MNATYKINEKFNGIEISFTEKPGEIIRGELKKEGFRWHAKRCIWYARSTESRLDFAKRITGNEAGEIVKAEGKAKEKAAKMTVARLNQIKEGYSFKATGEGIYAGWTGNNYSSLCGQDLKKAIIAELKKNGIKATGREGGNYLCTQYTFTITVPEEFRVSEDEYICNEMERKSWGGRFWYYKPDGSQIHRDALFNLSDAEITEIRRETARREYASAVSEQKDATVKPEFVEAVKVIVGSFNSDHSNSQIDYFDRSFYESYRWKIA